MSAIALEAAWAAAWEPPPDIRVSEWADRYRMLPETSAARGGKWTNETAPYLTGIMDAANDPSIRVLAFMKCVQSGGSEALNNIIGYFIHHNPCTILKLLPTVGMAQADSKERLADMIRTTPALASVVRDRAQPKTQIQQAESTIAMKVFPGGFLMLDGANSPNPFRRVAIRLGIGDDVDSWPPDVGEEGDPVDLLVNRGTTFFDAQTIFVSTPTLKDGRIDTLYSRSDRRRYFVPCPDCGRWDWITWNDAQHFRVGFDEERAETARIECPCGARMGEPDRREMVVRGEWRATAAATQPGLAGFHLPAMVSTLGDITLEGLVGNWLSARSRGNRALQVFVNTKLAEGWEDRTERVQPHTFLSRRESYGEGVDVPAAVPILTAGVDVQIDRFELQVIGWGLAGERWVIDWRSIPGDPRRPETRTALIEALEARYVHASGHALPIRATCVDSGYATEEIYEFILTHQHRGLYATKGYAGRSGQPVVGKVNEKTYGARRRPVRLYPINVDDAKAEIMASLSVASPGPGYMHFPEKVDEEYFAQLCAEHRETRRNKAGIATHFVWVQDRERNEALDTAVLALAAFRLMDGPRRLRHEADRLAALGPGGPGRHAAPAAPKETRQASRERWLDRERSGGWLKGNR